MTVRMLMYSGFLVGCPLMIRTEQRLRLTLLALEPIFASFGELLLRIMVVSGKVRSIAQFEHFIGGGGGSVLKVQNVFATYRSTRSSNLAFKFEELTQACPTIADTARILTDRSLKHAQMD